MRLELAEADEFSAVCQSLLHVRSEQGERLQQSAEKGMVRWRGI